MLQPCQHPPKRPALTTSPRDDALRDRRYVTLLLRLLVDRRQGLMQGELVDLDGQLLARFAESQELGQAVRTALERHLASDPG